MGKMADMLFLVATFVVVLARFSSEELRTKGCFYEHDLRTYRCAGITRRFPNQVYGNFHLKCEYDCKIPVFSEETFPYSNSLVSFNVSNSGIENVTKKAFSNLANVQYFYLQNNHIYNIEERAFYGLRQVYEIHLENNKLMHLNPGFLDHLEANSIFLSHNQIFFLPENSFKGLLGVMSLDLSFNNISIIYPESFNHLEGLENLNLEHNRICNLPLNAFKPVSTLRTLNLAFNKLRKFTTGAFSSLQDLGSLNLTGNDLIHFEDNALLPMSRISVLDISSNGLYYLDPHQLHSSAPTLRQLRVDDNLFSCSFLTNMVIYLKKNSVQILNDAKRYDLQNVLGIACTDEPVPEKVAFEEFLKIVLVDTKKNINIC